jgi:hypothetical protein
VAPSSRRSATQPTRKSVKVTAGIDADLYVRMAAGAAMRQVSHSRFVADALEAALREQGVFVGTRRRNADCGDPSIQGTGSATEAA